jgi:hypothetical protein
LITAPGPLHARVKALEEQIHGMKITDSALEKGIDAIAERSAKYECPCFFAINGASSCKERNQGRGDAKTCPSFPGSCFDCGYVGCIHCGKTVTVPEPKPEGTCGECEFSGTPGCLYEDEVPDDSPICAPRARELVALTRWREAEERAKTAEERHFSYLARIELALREVRRYQKSGEPEFSDAAEIRELIACENNAVARADKAEAEAARFLAAGCKDEDEIKRLDTLLAEATKRAEKAEEEAQRYLNGWNKDKVDCGVVALALVAHDEKIRRDERERVAKYIKARHPENRNCDYYAELIRAMPDEEKP